MKCKLYFKGKFQSEHQDIEDAQAQARFIHYEFKGSTWEGTTMPYGFMIVIVSPETQAQAEDNVLSMASPR
jgi:hypothetical protein